MGNEINVVIDNLFNKLGEMGPGALEAGKVVMEHGVKAYIVKGVVDLIAAVALIVAICYIIRLIKSLCKKAEKKEAKRKKQYGEWRFDIADYNIIAWLIALAVFLGIVAFGFLSFGLLHTIAPEYGFVKSLIRQ